MWVAIAKMKVKQKHLKRLLQITYLPLQLTRCQSKWTADTAIKKYGKDK